MCCCFLYKSAICREQDRWAQERQILRLKVDSVRMRKHEWKRGGKRAGVGEDHEVRSVTWRVEAKNNNKLDYSYPGVWPYLTSHIPVTPSCWLGDRGCACLSSSRCGGEGLEEGGQWIITPPPRISSISTQNSRVAQWGGNNEQSGHFSLVDQAWNRLCPITFTFLKILSDLNYDRFHFNWLANRRTCCGRNMCKHSSWRKSHLMQLMFQLSKMAGIQS